MTELSERDKLRILLDHWIEHNNGHIGECREWLERVEDLEEEAAEAIKAAITGFSEASRALSRALEVMGGVPEGHHHHHH